jgi:alcohol dehydrogenase
VKNLLDRLNKASGLPIRLRDAGVTEDKLPAIAQAAINDGALIFNPADMTLDEALALLKKAY